MSRGGDTHLPGIRIPSDSDRYFSFSASAQALEGTLHYTRRSRHNEDDAHHVRAVASVCLGRRDCWPSREWSERIHPQPGAQRRLLQCRKPSQPIRTQGERRRISSRLGRTTPPGESRNTTVGVLRNPHAYPGVPCTPAGVLVDGGSVTKRLIGSSSSESSVSQSLSRWSEGRSFPTSSASVILQQEANLEPKHGLQNLVSISNLTQKVAPGTGSSSEPHRQSLQSDSVPHK